MRGRPSTRSSLVPAILGAASLALSPVSVLAAGRPQGRSAASASRQFGCRAPQLRGLTIRSARTRAARAGCRLRIRGSRVRTAAIQTVARQNPGAGAVARVVTVWVNPLCSRTADSGPPPGEPIVTAGPTELVSGLFLEGGPLILFSNPRCTFKPEQPWAGTVTVSDPRTGTTVATETVPAGRLARFRLAAGTYTINATFANATGNGEPFMAHTTVTIPDGKTVRQDITVYVP
jgi:hypothetical protein